MAKSGDETQIESYQAGADFYLEKPFHPAALYEQVKNLLQSREKLIHRYIAGQVEAAEIVSNNLDAKFKLFIQLSIATIVYLLGVKISSVPFFGGLDLGFWSYPITLLWIVGISNAVNFIDGVDGLAGSVITVNSITLAIIAIAMTPSNPIVALIGFILAGSMLAFLTYNFNPAKIFMGDSGALFSGFLLATISIVGVMKAATLTLLLPFVVLAVPIMDIVFSSTRRICKGKSPFVADAEHIHHKLLHAGFSQKKTVLILTSVAIVAGAIASLLMGENTIKHYAVYILVIVFIMLLLNFIKVLTKK